MFDAVEVAGVSRQKRPPTARVFNQRGRVGDWWKGVVYRSSCTVAEFASNSRSKYAPI